MLLDTSLVSFLTLLIFVHWLNLGSTWGLPIWLLSWPSLYSLIMMPLHSYILFQALLQDNSQIKCEQYILCFSDVPPRDIFNPHFADDQPTYVFWYLCLKQLVTSIFESGLFTTGVISWGARYVTTVFSSLVVYSFLWLWRPWACGQVQVFSSYIILLLVPLSIVEFPVVKPSKICYNSCWLSYCPTMVRCYCAIFPSCQ